MGEDAFERAGEHGIGGVKRKAEYKESSGSHR
jgi:hypothetical protein